MSELASLQRALQGFVLSGEARAPASATGQVQVYRDAYVARLCEALGANYPTLQRWLGDAEFRVLAARYIAARPSTTASIRWFGHALEEWLAQQRPDEPWLSELAGFEWRIAAAFDAQDATPEDVGAIATVEPHRWPTLCLSLHPSLLRQRVHTNAIAVYAELNGGATIAPDPAALALPEEWLIWRRGDTTQYRLLPAHEARALDCMLAQASFAEMCAALSDSLPETEVPLVAASLLKRWFEDELIVGVRYSDE